MLQVKEIELELRSGNICARSSRAAEIADDAEFEEFEAELAAAMEEE